MNIADISKYLSEITTNAVARTAKKILSKRDLSFYKQNDLRQSIFVIDKYLNGKIPPICWKVVLSKEIEDNKAVQKSTRFRQLKKLLEDGNPSINCSSLNFLPKSSRHFFMHSKDGKPIVDYQNSFFGIRHFHLGSANDDKLLIYALDSDTVYFIAIGSHQSLLSIKIIKKYYDEFPDVAETNGLHVLPGVLPGGNESSQQEVEDTWNNGGNISLEIHNKVITGQLQSTSGYPKHLLDKYQNLLFQIVSSGKQLFDHFNGILNTIEIWDIFDSQIGENGIKLIEKSTNTEFLFDLDYFAEVRYVEKLLSL